jgi:hypothetical protein
MNYCGLYHAPNLLEMNPCGNAKRSLQYMGRADYKKICESPRKEWLPVFSIKRSSRRKS